MTALTRERFRALLAYSLVVTTLTACAGRTSAADKSTDHDPAGRAVKLTSSFTEIRLPAPSEGAAAALDEQGRVVVAGRQLASDQNPSQGAGPDVIVARLVNRRLDRTFADDGIARISLPGVIVDSLLSSPDGHITVAGTEGTHNQRAVMLMQLTSDGDIDSDFGEAGTASLNFGQEPSSIRMLVQGDDHILVGGNVDGEGLRIARLNKSGQLDKDFAIEGYLDTHLMQATFLALSDGEIVVTGADTGPDGRARQPTGRLIHFSAQGKPTSHRGKPLDALVRLMDVDASNRLLGVVDDFSNVNSGYALVRLLSNGKNDDTFAEGGQTAIIRGSSPYVEDLVSLGDDLALVVNYENDSANVARYDERGQYRDQASPEITPVFESAAGLAVNEGRQVIVVGSTVREHDAGTERHMAVWWAPS